MQIGDRVKVKTEPGIVANWLVGRDVRGTVVKSDHVHSEPGKRLVRLDSRVEAEGGYPHLNAVWVSKDQVEFL